MVVKLEDGVKEEIADQDSKRRRFGDLLPTDLFSSRKYSYVTGDFEKSPFYFMKLKATFRIGCAGMANTYSIDNGGLYCFRDDEIVELERYRYEWLQGFQVTESCLECGRPRKV